jgi:hypothetical protein
MTSSILGRSFPSCPSHSSSSLNRSSLTEMIVQQSRIGPGFPTDFSQGDVSYAAHRKQFFGRTQKAFTHVTGRYFGIFSCHSRLRRVDEPCCQGNLYVLPCKQSSAEPAPKACDVVCIFAPSSSPPSCNSLEADASKACAIQKVESNDKNRGDRWGSGRGVGRD